MVNKNQKSAIIVGASGGIGGAVAQRLAQDGFAVVAHYAGNSARADAMVKDLVASGARAIAVKADVASETDVDGLFQTALEAFGKIDVVVDGGKIIVELSRKGYESARAVKNPLTYLAEDTNRSQRLARRSQKTAIVIGPASHRLRRYARAAHCLNRTNLQPVSTSDVFDRPLTRASSPHASRAVGRRT